MQDLTPNEKGFLIELLNKIQFNINGIEQATFARNIKIKLSRKEEEKKTNKA